MSNNADCAGCYESPCVCKSNAKTARKQARRLASRTTQADAHAATAPDLPLTEVRDALLDAGHWQAKWVAPRQWSGGFACKQTTLNEAEVAVYHIWGVDEQPPDLNAGKPGAEMPAMLAYQGALLRAGYAAELLAAAPNPLLLVSRSAGEQAWAAPWRIDTDGRAATGRGVVDEVSGVRVG